MRIGRQSVEVNGAGFTFTCRIAAVHVNVWVNDEVKCVNVNGPSWFPRVVTNHEAEHAAVRFTQGDPRCKVIPFLASRGPESIRSARASLRVVRGSALGFAARGG
jgi:hypothetical protein